MKKMKLLFIVTLIIVNYARSQTVINQVSETYTGVTDTVDLAPIIIDVNNKVIVAGNQKVSPTQYDATTAQQLSNGIMTWTASFNLSTQKSWVTSSATDGSGNVFITGGVATGTTNGVDLFVLAYDNGGNQMWSYTYNGPNSTTDVGMSITTDNSNNVYVTGPSDGTLTSTADYVTICLDAMGGAQKWEQRYDYASSFDIPGQIVYNSGSDDIEVTGASASNAVDFDICTLTYRPDGTLVNTNRLTTIGGYDKAFGMATDTLGNVYVAGTSWSSISNSYDLSIQKLDSSLNAVWINSFDGYGFNDAGISVDIDDSLNIFVAGLSYLDSIRRELKVLKYDNNGNLKWKREIGQMFGASDAEAVKVRVKSENEIFVGGNVTINGNQDLILLRYDKNGALTLSKTYNGPANGKDKFMDFQVNGNSIYVSARTYSTGNLDQNVTITYEYKDLPRTVTTSTAFASHLENRFVVQFRKNMVDTTKLNNKKITFGELGDFLTSQAIGKLDTLLEISTSRLIAHKVFPNLTSRDSISTSRCGNLVKLPPLYATLGIVFSNGINDTLVESKLRNAFDICTYADMNYVFDLNNAPNDPDYTNGNSAGLDVTTTYSLSSINTNPAWDIESGQSNIIVGVFDTGINYQHSDFNGSGLSTSKVTTGYDYYNNVPYLGSTPVDKLGHGTGDAGIIGAIRNNGIAVAGIAGGDGSVNNPGVTLHDMKIAEGNDGAGSAPYFGASLDAAARAIIDGAIGSPTANIGLAQHIQNHSWSKESNIAPQYSTTTIQNLLSAIRVAFENEVVLSFSSGNNENSSFTNNVYNIPGNFKDEFNLLSGGIDETGNRWSSGTNASEGGRYLDVVAPCKNTLFNLLDKNSNGTVDYFTYGGIGNTQTLVANGTSQAAPHTSGLAALMLSYINNHTQKPNNIAPEDVEKLIEKYATDLYPTTSIPTYSVGYDQQTGYGRINAGLTMSKIKIPEFLVKHYNINTTVANCSVVQTGTLESIWFPYNWNIFTAGYGVVNKYEITYVNTHTVGSYSIDDAWKRDALTNLAGNLSVASPGAANPGPPGPGLNDIPNEVGGNLYAYTNSNATLKGYAYEILMYNGSGYVPSGYWYPFDITNSSQPIKFGYTLYLHDPVQGIKENDLKKDVSVYPNPTSDKINIQFKSGSNSKVNVKIIDIAGKQLYDNNLILSADNSTQIDVSGLINGIYFITLRIEDGRTKTFKQIIAK